MAVGESTIVCPACRKKTSAPTAQDGKLFSCNLCVAKLRWRARGSEFRLELLSAPQPSVQVDRQNLGTNPVRAAVPNPRPATTLSLSPKQKPPKGTSKRYVYLASGIFILVILLGVASYGLSGLFRSSDVPITTVQDPPTEETQAKPSAADIPLTRADLIANFEPSVCKLITPESSGTGFLVAPNLIATNKHVVGCWDAKYLRGEFLSSSTSLLAGTENSWEVRNLTLAYATDDYDLCFLRAESIPPSCRPITPAKMESLSRGQEVIVIGCPYGQEGTITPGVLNQLRNDIDTQPLLSLSAAVNPGNSGGPVITMRGEAAGVVVLKHGLADGLGYAVPASALSESLRHLADDTQLQLKKNTSDYFHLQAATALSLSTTEIVGLLSSENDAVSSNQSIVRVDALLSNTHSILQSPLLDRSQAKDQLLAKAFAQLTKLLAKLKSESEQVALPELESLVNVSQQLKKDIGLLEFELPNKGP